MNNDNLKMIILVNGIAVGLLEKISLRMTGDKVEIDFGSGNARNKVTLEGKSSAALRDRIKKTEIPLHSSDIPSEDFNGVIFDVNVENRNGKMHLRWVNKAAGMEDLQTLIAEVMKLNPIGKKTGTAKK